MNVHYALLILAAVTICNAKQDYSKWIAVKNLTNQPIKKLSLKVLDPATNERYLIDLIPPAQLFPSKLYTPEPGYTGILYANKITLGQSSADVHPKIIDILINGREQYINTLQDVDPMYFVILPDSVIVQVERLYNDGTMHVDGYIIHPNGAITRPDGKIMPKSSKGPFPTITRTGKFMLGSQTNYN